MAVVETDENQESFYFEGVEKLLELWFKNSSNTDSFNKDDLRKIPREEFEKLLKAVHCEVISFSCNDKVDAYVLSESSMFVSERRFILKTCGTTTPLECLQPLLNLVDKYTSFTDIQDIFYSRKNFKKPELQRHPHKSFEDEVKYLDSFFDNGVGVQLGTNETDCWYLYFLAGSGGHKHAVDGFIENLATDGDYDEEPYDQTLEVLMTDLDPAVMDIFTKDSSSSALEATQKSGINTIFPEMKIDDYLFDPCGYSMNGITKNGNYMTIHITPEPDFSYVSFETDVPQSSFKDIVQRVVAIFNPGKVLLTLFTNKRSVAREFVKSATSKRGILRQVGTLECQEVDGCRLRSYDVGFAFYSKFPS